MDTILTFIQFQKYIRYCQLHDLDSYYLIVNRLNIFEMDWPFLFFSGIRCVKEDNFTLFMTRYDKDPTHLYKRYRPPNGHSSYVKCLQSENRGGILYHCTFQQRESRFEENIKKGIIHTCDMRPEEEADRGSILHYAERTNAFPPKPEEIIEEGLVCHLVEMIGAHDLSLETASSNSFYKFMCHAIEYGTAHPGIEATILLSHYKKDYLRNKLINIADQKPREVISRFSSQLYVSVAIDEGRNKNLHSYPATVQTMNSLNALAYVPTLSAGLIEINQYKMNISTVVCDGCKAQKKAFSPRWENSLPRTSKHPWVKQIIFIPCLAHRIQNAFEWTPPR
jgi:hypothetical protein